MPERIPALIVSGFLGSGKTTLVRHLLADAQAHGQRLAVVSNEFGELGIDRALLGERRDDYVELSGGCVCCKLSDALVETLQALWERARPDRIVVETSGVALPFDTQMNLWRDPVREWIEDDVAVVVVNAEQVDAGRELGETFEQQVSSADLLVLNQTDRVETSAVARIEAGLRELEPDAPIVRAVHTDVEPALLFPPDPGGARARRRERAPEAPPHGHERFETAELEVEVDIASEALIARLRAERALRVKGFARTREGLRLVQGVGPRIDVAEVETAPADLVGRLVVVRRA
jgi:cobalamin biosynthesis protein CobW